MIIKQLLIKTLQNLPRKKNFFKFVKKTLSNLSIRPWKNQNSKNHNHQKRVRDRENESTRSLFIGASNGSNFESEIKINIGKWGFFLLAKLSALNSFYLPQCTK